MCSAFQAVTFSPLVIPTVCVFFGLLLSEIIGVLIFYTQIKRLYKIFCRPNIIRRVLENGEEKSPERLNKVCSFHVGDGYSKDGLVGPQRVSVRVSRFSYPKFLVVELL